MLGATIADIHAHRNTLYAAAGYDVGATYYETDRNTLYVIENVSGVLTWKWAAGLMQGTFSARPTDLAAADTGFQFQANDFHAQTYTWSGAFWSPIQPTSLSGAHSSRVYQAGSANGTTAAGVNKIIRSTGPNFAAYQVGLPLAFAGQLRTILTFIDGNTVTVDGPAFPSVGEFGSTFFTQYPSNEFALNTLYYETDRTVYYTVQDSYGNAGVTGQAVVWIGGPKFDPYWTEIHIGTSGRLVRNVDFFVNSPTSITLAAALGNFPNASVYVPRGAWYYTDGTYSSFSNAPADLDPVVDVGFKYYSQTTHILYLGQKVTFSGLDQFYFGYMLGEQVGGLADLLGLNLESADAGYLFDVQDVQHRFRWNGASWDFAPGDPGNGWYAIGPPVGGLWAPADGSTILLIRPNATFSTVTTLNLTGDVVLQGGAGGAVSSQKAATAAKWDPAAVTDLASTGDSVSVSTSSIGTGTSGSATVVGGVSLNDPTHQHTLSNANAKLLPPSETNGGMPLRISVPWFIRL
jgi:hypothetical protein